MLEMMVGLLDGCGVYVFCLLLNCLVIGVVRGCIYMSVIDVKVD